MTHYEKTRKFLSDLRTILVEHGASIKTDRDGDITLEVGIEETYFVALTVEGLNMVLKDTFEARKDIPYEQVNNPIQIQHTIVDPPAGYHQAIELLTVLYQDGTIMQGRCTAGYGGHVWQKIDVTLPTVKCSKEDQNETDL